MSEKIGVDFDGVLSERIGIPREKGFENSSPVKDAQDAIKWMIDNGFNPYVFTNRAMDEWDDIKEWLDDNDFEPMEVTNVKQEGTFLYIDDRAVRFTNWQDVCKLLG